jgi:hypothetical protein
MNITSILDRTGQQNVTFFFPLKYVNIHFFSHFTWLSQKKTVGEGEKLLTYLNSALKVLLGTDSFPRVPKKVKFCCPVKNVNTVYKFFHSSFTFNLAVTKQNRG